MTGFGSAEAQTQSGTYRIEIRGVNNRFFEMQLRQPRFINNLDQIIRKEIQAVITRGSLTVIITCDRDEEARKLSYDRNTVAQYTKILREIKKRTNSTARFRCATCSISATLSRRTPRPLTTRRSGST